MIKFCLSSACYLHFIFHLFSFREPLSFTQILLECLQGKPFHLLLIRTQFSTIHHALINYFSLSISDFIRAIKNGRKKGRKIKRMEGKKDNRDGSNFFILFQFSLTGWVEKIKKISSFLLFPSCGQRNFHLFLIYFYLNFPLEYFFYNNQHTHIATGKKLRGGERRKPILNKFSQVLNAGEWE